MEEDVHQDQGGKMGQMPKDGVVLVTGCASGIGRATAEALKQTSYRLVITFHNPKAEEDLRRLMGDRPGVLLRPLDVTDYAMAGRLVDEVNQTWGGVDALINNAGISFRSVVEHMSPGEEEFQMATNYLGPMHLIRLVLPRMRARCRGRIINISSVSGMMAVPTMASYTASKFALEGASEALWYELKPWNISVTLIEPGFIRSEGYKKVYLSQAGRASQEGYDGYTSYYRHMSRFVEGLMNSTPVKPDKLARLVVKTLARPSPPLRMPATLDAWVFYLLRRLLPRRLYHGLIYAGLPQVEDWGGRQIRVTKEIFPDS